MYVSGIQDFFFFLIRLLIKKIAWTQQKHCVMYLRLCIIQQTFFHVHVYFVQQILFVCPFVLFSIAYCLADIASHACVCVLFSKHCIMCLCVSFSKHCFMCLCLHCFSLIFSLVALYYINRLSSAKYAPVVSTVPVGPSKKKK